MLCCLSAYVMILNHLSPGGGYNLDGLVNGCLFFFMDWQDACEYEDVQEQC
jgi:hypothetical protein